MSLEKSRVGRYDEEKMVQVSACENQSKIT